MTTLADELRVRMRAAGLTPKMLARLADVNETYVRDILRGKSRNPRVEHLAKVTTVLGTSLSEIMPRAAPETVREKIGRRIRFVREYLQKSVEEFAGALNITAAELTAYEAGGTPIAGEVIVALAQATGVSTDFLFLGSMGRLPPEMATWMRARMPEEASPEPRWSLELKFR